MAGIQVPKINRFEPQGPAPAGQNTVNIPDTSKAASVQTDAVLDVAAQQLKYFQDQEDAVIDTASKDAANRYSIYLNEELNKARLQKGDPTQVYAQFTENLNAKYEEILNSNPNLTERGKQAFGQQLRDVATNYKIKSNTAYSGQYFDYDNEVTDSAIKIQSNDLPTVASFIVPGDEKSFEGMDKIIRNIGNLRKNQGEKFGAVTRDENGNQVTTKTIDLKIAKDVSDGLLSTIDILTADNKPELAEAVYARYNNFLDNFKKDNVLKDIAENKQTVKALNTIPSTVGKSPDEIEALLNKEFKDDPKGKFKAYELLEADQRRKYNMTERISSNAYDTAFNIVYKRMQGDDPYTNVFEMERSISKYLKLIVDPNKRKALQELVDKPSKSDPDVYEKNLGYVGNMAYTGMSESKLMEELQGLSEPHKKFFVNQWVKQRTETESSVRSKINDGWTRLRSKLIDGGVIPTSNGEVTKSGKQTLTRIETKYRLSSDRFSKDTSYNEQEQLRNQIYDEELKIKKEGRGAIGKFWDTFTGKNSDKEIDRKPYFPSAPNSPLDPNKSRTVPKSEAAPITDTKTGAVTPSENMKLTKSQLQSSKESFIKEKGRKPVDFNELQVFIKEKGIK